MRPRRFRKPRTCATCAAPLRRMVGAYCSECREQRFSELSDLWNNPENRLKWAV